MLFDEIFGNMFIRLFLGIALVISGGHQFMTGSLFDPFGVLLQWLALVIFVVGLLFIANVLGYVLALPNNDHKKES